jgi:opacity protein-like surface antigen
MKKLMLFAAVAVFSLSNVNAQEVNFGAKAGVDLASAKAEFDGFSASASETGFYIGAFAEIGISEEFSVQPEVLYVSIKDLGQVHVPIMAKYGVSEEFSILAGPTISFLTDTVEGMSSMNYGIEAGVAYDITEEILVEARYNIGLANLIEDAPDGASYKLSGIFIGVGYRF